MEGLVYISRNIIETVLCTEWPNKDKFIAVSRESEIDKSKTFPGELCTFLIKTKHTKRLFLYLFHRVETRFIHGHFVSTIFFMICKQI